MDIGLQDEIKEAVSEIIQIESHSCKSFIGTGDNSYLKLLDKARQIRTKWMEKIYTEKDNSQNWCLTKHIFSASTRLSEVGTKLLSLGRFEEGEQAFLDSGEILGMYYFLNTENKDKQNESEKKSFLDRFKL